MLGLQVPVPPSTQDFTKVQYSYTDGVSSSTITKWEQIANDPDYNYIVTHHYYADKYTGSMKQLSDPQVQISGTSPATMQQLHSALMNVETSKAAMETALNNKNATDSAYAAAQLATAAAEAAMLNAQEAVTNANIPAGTTLQDALTAMYNAQSDYITAQDAYNDLVSNSKNIDSYDESPMLSVQLSLGNGVYQDGQTPPLYEFKEFTSLTQQQQQEIFDMLDALRTHGVEVPIGSGTSLTTLNLTNIDNMEWAALQNEVNNNGPITSISSSYSQEIQNLMNSVYYNTVSSASGLIAFKADLEKNADPNTQEDLRNFKSSTVQNISNTYSTEIPKYYDQNEPLYYIPGLYNEFVKAEDIYNLLKAEDDATTAYINAQAAEITPLNNKRANDAAYNSAVAQYDAAKSTYDTLSKPAYIGNSKLTQLATLTEDQEIELKQIVSDMEEQNINTDIRNCFDANGNYLGGIYTFQLNGTTYYTTYNNLIDAYNSYQQQGSDKIIDGQYKMPYYNASYISTKIETTEKALLETDEAGRFSSIRFQDDSVKYELKTETITDDVAYEDAMNKYYYDNAIYDKTVQDINAKTSLIHQQDQQLELRLHQLDTEQKALSTEMEAVKKIVQKNVEDSFKTFNG